MARFLQFPQVPIVSPTLVEGSIGRTIRAQIARLMRRGVFVALLVVVMGVGLGISGPVAHAALATPNAGCSIYQIAVSGTQHLPNGWGHYYSILWAKYDSTGHWCNVVWGEAYMREFPGAPSGTLRLNIYNCDAPYQAVQYGVGVSGGGTGSGGIPYFVNSRTYDWSSVKADAQFTSNSGTVYTSTTTWCTNT